MCRKANKKLQNALLVAIGKPLSVHLYQVALKYFLERKEHNEDRESKRPEKLCVTVSVLRALKTLFNLHTPRGFITDSFNVIFRLRFLFALVVLHSLECYFVMSFRVILILCDGLGGLCSVIMYLCHENIPR